MRTKNKVIAIILLMIIVYSIINMSINNHVFGLSRTTDLTTIDKSQYRGVLPFIQELQIAYPNWSFTILNTGLDWNAVITAETTSNHRRSLTQNTDPAWLCSDCGLTAYDSGWYGASKQAVEYYMDPRNWLNGKNIFSFEALSFNASMHNIDGVKAILKGTFMDKNSITYTDTAGNTQTINKSYAQIIMEAAEDSGVSPYHLASRIRQEQGAGNSALISGTFKNGDVDYTGYYNYFNIGASGDGQLNIIKRGLKYAKDSGWTSPELSIKGGAKFIASGYIGKGQDTLYLEKYNVNTTNIESAASHQYMQNISAHISEGLSVYNAYNSIGVLNTNFNFIIPVFENMPQEISPRPTTSTDLTTETVMTTAPILHLRESNSTGSTSLASLPLGSSLLRVETAKSVINGYYWDKVMYFNDNKAIIGYVARNYISKIQDTSNSDEIYYTTSCAILKNGPGINLEPKKILDANTELTVMDKMEYKIDNMIWYRVKLADGTQGYVATNFIKSMETHEEEPVTGEVYKIVEDYVITVPGAKIEQIEGAITADQKFATGTNLDIGEKKYTLVMLGDTNGDGTITPLDYVKIKNNIMGTTKLEGCYAVAADVNRDGNITPLDYVKVKNHIMSVNRIGF